MFIPYVVVFHFNKKKVISVYPDIPLILPLPSRLNYGCNTGKKYKPMFAEQK